MTELFLINYETEQNGWICHTQTHSLRVATEYAKVLRDMDYRVTVQSVLINEHGKVEL